MSLTVNYRLAVYNIKIGFIDATNMANSLQKRYADNGMAVAKTSHFLFTFQKPCYYDSEKNDFPATYYQDSAA